MKILGIIPARYGSTRFPAKALADIDGKPMVWRVYQQAMESTMLMDVIVATDHKEIYDAVLDFGGKAVMTSDQHPSGTDRCFEAFQQWDGEYDYVVNIQGDEPFIKPLQIDECARLLDGSVELATLVTKIKSEDMLFSHLSAKVIFNRDMEAIYFSREVIPHLKGVDRSDYLAHHTFYKHVSIYAYRTDILEQITQLSVSTLEKSESLEQLRWIENGYKIKIGVTDTESFGIDTPEDLERAIKLFKL